MILTDDDYETLASQIEEGEDYATLDKDGECLEVHYECEEDDYFNGTGAWVTTAVNLQVLDVTCTDDDGNLTDTDFDDYKLYKTVREQKVL